jgi:catechol 2,3-dioxygenase-like lactoylglutathione lyase family enzyme
MAVHAVSHIAIGVSDMERALGFYRDLLGLRVTADMPEQFSHGPGEPPTRRRAVFLRWVDGPQASFIVLDQKDGAEANARAPLFGMGVHHFSLWIDDLDDLLERAAAAGIEIARREGSADTKAYGEPAGGSVRSVILRDPEGNHVQFDQRV